MTAALALVRASWQTAISYRVSMLLSVGALLVSVVPIYFVANALQPTMADVIATEGGQYFGFLVAGIIGQSVMVMAIATVPGEIGAGIRTGTLEALLATPARPASLLAGFLGYPFAWTCVRVLLLLAAATVLGAPVDWTRIGFAYGMVALIALAYLPFGILGAASILLFRTSGPLAQAVVVLSGLLGGVYYPTHVIPSWIEHLSAAIPLTYALRALRRGLFQGAPLVELAGDVFVLLGLTALFAASALLAFRVALRHARRAGNLAQY
jgi:ABC-type multidrug transport system permease subunit